MPSRVGIGLPAPFASPRHGPVSSMFMLTLSNTVYCGFAVGAADMAIVHVDWGDTTSEDVTLEPWDEIWGAEVGHNYSAPGTYVVTVTALSSYIYLVSLTPGNGETAIDISAAVALGLTYMLASGCGLSSAMVDNVLGQLAAGTVIDGVADLTGNEPPGVDGLAAKTTLEGRGWTVSVTPPIIIALTVGLHVSYTVWGSEDVSFDVVHDASTDTAHCVWDGSHFSSVKNSTVLGTPPVSWTISGEVAKLVGLIVHDHGVIDASINQDAALAHLDLRSNGMGSAAVDAVLVDLAAGAVSNGYVYLTGNSVPGVDGLAAKTTLEGRGWTVEVDTLATVGVVDHFDGTGNIENHTPDMCPVGESWALEFGRLNDELTLSGGKLLGGTVGSQPGIAVIAAALADGVVAVTFEVGAGNEVQVYLRAGHGPTGLCLMVKEGWPWRLTDASWNVVCAGAVNVDTAEHTVHLVLNGDQASGDLDGGDAASGTIVDDSASTMLALTMSRGASVLDLSFVPAP